MREHREELLEMIRQGKYKPQPVRRKEIPKPDGGMRKLGIPTVVDRIIQQAIAQQLTPIYEPLFSDNSFGYRPGRSAQMAILRVKEYAEKGYIQAVLVDLSKYFDTLNHELLMNLLRKNIHDKRVIELIKRYLKASVFAIRNFKFLGFALGKGRKGVYVRAHAKSLKKAKAKLKELTSRSQGRNVRAVMQNVKVYIRGWLGYFGIANMKTTMQRWDEWLRRRFRSYIWKQWKLPKTRVKNLVKLGMPQWQAYRNGNSRKGYWAIAGSGILTKTITNERLVQAGYYSILDRYESMHLCD